MCMEMGLLYVHRIFLWTYEDVNRILTRGVLSVTS